MKDDEGANKGTTCTVRMDLCSGANKYDVSNLKTDYTIGKRSFVFGAGDNVAMLQTASGAVPDENFFETLETAVESEATTGKTIKLCNDCDENVTVGKACTIDTNGFDFTGAITAVEGYSVVESDGKYVISMPDPADVLVEKVEVATIVDQVVSADWLEENNIDANASQDEIQAAVQEKLKEEDTNGNAKWENLVLGQKADETAAVTAANGGTETTANIEVSFEVPTDAETGDKIDTGYTVKYAFDKADENGVVTNVTESVATTPTLDFTEVTANEPTYFKMRAVLEATDNSGVTSEVPVDKTIGVVKVASDAEVTIIPVPWQSLGDSDITATELVHAASLTKDDVLTVYDSNGNSKSWSVNEKGEWALVTTYEMDESQQTQQAQPQVNDGLKRGQAAILTRSKPKETEIVLIGQPPTNTVDKVETDLAPVKEDGEPTWNLVASPKMEAVAVADVASSNTSDEIIVPTAGTPKHYTYKEGKWGYTGKVSEMEVTLPGGVKTTAVQFGHKTDDPNVPAGTGFWYLNKDTSTDKKIAW